MLIKYALNIIHCTDDGYNNLIDNLNYYMLKSKKPSQILYYVVLKHNLIVIYASNDDFWSKDKIQSIVNFVFKDNSSFIIFNYTGHTGLFSPRKIKELNRAKYFFRDTYKYRKIVRNEMKSDNRRRKLDKIVSNININAK